MLNTVVRLRFYFLCILLALVARVSKRIRRVWARYPPAHAESVGTNGFTALLEWARDGHIRARRKQGDYIPERGSFHNGLVLLCRDNYDKLVACCEWLANIDSSVRQRYPATSYVFNLTSKLMSTGIWRRAVKSFDGGPVCYAQQMRSPCALPSSVGLETKQSQPPRSS